MRKDGWPRGFRFDEKTGKYFCRPVYPGGRRRKTTLGDDEKRALAWFHRIMRDIEDEREGLVDRVQQRQSIREVAERYLSWHAGRVSVKHAVETRRGIMTVIDLLAPSTIGDLKKDHLYRVQAALDNGKRSVRTINKMVGHFLSCLSWAEKTGAITSDPIRSIIKLEAPAESRNRAKLTVDEARALISTIRKEDEKKAHWERRLPQEAFVRIQLEAGLRFGEAAALEWRDFERRTIKGPNGESCRFWFVNVRKDVAKGRKTTAVKGRAKARTVPIREDLARLIADLRAIQGRVLGRLPRSTDIAFRTQRGRVWERGSNTTGGLVWFNRKLADAGIPKTRVEGGVTLSVDWHALRHTFCQWLRDQQTPTGEAADLMGHDERLTRGTYSEAPSGSLRAIEHIQGLPDVVKKPKDDEDDIERLG